MFVYATDALREAVPDRKAMFRRISPRCCASHLIFSYTHIPCAIDYYYYRSTRLNIILKIAGLTRCTANGDYIYGITAKRLLIYQRGWGEGRRRKTVRVVSEKRSGGRYLDGYRWRINLKQSISAVELTVRPNLIALFTKATAQACSEAQMTA